MRSALILAQLLLSLISVNAFANKLSNLYLEVKTGQGPTNENMLYPEDCVSLTDALPTFACDLALSYLSLQKEDYDTSYAALKRSQKKFDSLVKHRTEDAFDKTFVNAPSVSQYVDSNEEMNKMVGNQLYSIDTERMKECYTKNIEEFQQNGKNEQTGKVKEVMEESFQQLTELQKSGNISSEQYMDAYKDIFEKSKRAGRSKESNSSFNKLGKKNLECYKNNYGPSLSRVNFKSLMKIELQNKVREYQLMSGDEQANFRENWISEQIDAVKSINSEIYSQNFSGTSLNVPTMSGVMNSPLMERMVRGLGDMGGLAPNMQLSIVAVSLNNAVHSFDDGDADSAQEYLYTSMELLSPLYLEEYPAASQDLSDPLIVEFLHSLTIWNYTMNRSLDANASIGVDILGLSKGALPATTKLRNIVNQLGGETFSTQAAGIFAAAFDNELELAKLKLEKFRDTQRDSPLLEKITTEAFWFITYINFLNSMPAQNEAGGVTLERFGQYVTPPIKNDFSKAYEMSQETGNARLISVTEDSFALMLAATNDKNISINESLKAKVEALSATKEKNLREQTFAIIQRLQPSMEHNVLSYL